LETTAEERKFFRGLARLIGKRAARLSACGIAAIVRKKGLLEEGCEVGADGSLYNVSSFDQYDLDPRNSYPYRNIPDLQTEFMQGL
jgi:hexokinase